jgi:hypothetical protein
MYLTELSSLIMRELLLFHYIAYQVFFQLKIIQLPDSLVSFGRQVPIQ